MFKNGSPDDPCNYWPIYLTCIAYKLMECGVKDSLLVFLTEYKIINASQHGLNQPPRIYLSVIHDITDFMSDNVSVELLGD